MTDEQAREQAMRLAREQAMRLALNCVHGRWIGESQFAVCVPCVAAALQAQQPLFLVLLFRR